MVIRKGCPRAMMAWPRNVNQNLTVLSIFSSYKGKVERHRRAAPTIRQVDPYLTPALL